ncbi:FAD/NAD(P)-binding domain-containing protein [Clavulina sp. PMI_390]|nr:FAD/NAD(P)-binding domain-containing protein [Clavulina sp. PMI_390]
MLSRVLLLILSVSSAVARNSQEPLRPDNLASEEDLYWKLPNEIRRVAVIGAGPAGLQFTSTLIDHGFEVRMFERAPNPGGIWHYTDKLPIPAAFPNRPIETMAYIPDVPNQLPASRIYEDGDDGLTVDWRIREHWAPSPAWHNMMTTEPHQLMSLPNIGYPKNTVKLFVSFPDDQHQSHAVFLQPWKLHQMDVNRQVRQYASSVGLNANDEEHTNVTAYSTRVERVEKLPGTEKRWTVTLRKLIPLRDGKLEVNWWQEQFDAIVLGKYSENDAAWVPPIPGLDDWAHTLPDAIFHSRHYRRPEHFTNKNVLVVGGSFSGLGIANDLIGHARFETDQLHAGSQNSPGSVSGALRGMFHPNITFVSEVMRFKNRPSASGESLRAASVVFSNGTIASGFDAIILATGHRTSLPFLVGYHNSTIKGLDEPEIIVAPIITDGTHLRSLHWTGHYIDDPTLLLCTTFPFRDGATSYQALGAARVWAGTARLPSITRMWKTYPGASHWVRDFPIACQMVVRLFVTWLNDEILEFGGKLVSTQPVHELMELFHYYVNKQYNPGIARFYGGAISAERPRSQWDVYNGDEDDALQSQLLTHQQMKAVYGDPDPQHWAELSLRW